MIRPAYGMPPSFGKRELPEPTNTLDASPSFDDAVPMCSEDKCKHFDGKRCALLGFRPGNICEPVVRELLKRAQ